MTAALNDHFDVVILGAGLAGLSLARQLLLAGGRTVAMLDRRAVLPPTQQKVGEATVQLSGYYFSRVLEMEEHLLREHFLKYNLRFFWKTPGRANDALEDYSQSYIRNFSNIATFQLDRNKFEGALLRCNREDRNFALLAPVHGLRVEIDGRHQHTVHYEAATGPGQLTARWLVDASGRGRVLARKLELARTSPIRHGSAFLWVEGLLDVERLTARSAREVRLAPERATLGHLPFCLATNHFMGDGFWFWVIPLHGRTSLGLVYDRSKIARDEVDSPEKLVAWICREFPLFARDLPQRQIQAWAGFRDFAHDCRETISSERWALTGEAGRFSDPLYSPGGDLIALHNTLIADAIATADAETAAAKIPVYERLLRAFYEAYVPSYAASYNALGDQEVYALKYGWELSVYFGFYVFPFLNDLFTQRAFLPTYLAWFARLGPLNHALQSLLAAYGEWKGARGFASAAPLYFDFYEFGTLRAAERTFYEVGLGIDAAKGVLAAQLGNLEEMARFMVAWVAAAVVGDPALVCRAAFVSALDPARVVFDPEAFARLAAATASEHETWKWSFDPHILQRLRGTSGVAVSTPEPAATCP
jgi:flavin-dependent dehydrogenase